MSRQSEKERETFLSTIIVAAGTGNRMQAAEHKQLLQLAGKSVLETTIGAFELHPMVKEIIVVSHTAEVKRVTDEIIIPGGFKKVKTVIHGGATRTDSVKAGLAMISSEATHVAVHDGARPLITQTMLDDVFTQGIVTGAAILAVKVTDTIKKTDEKGKIMTTIPRTGLWAVQTPQVFVREWLEDAYEKLPVGASATDDAAVLEAAGYSVYTVESSKENMKITVPLDLVQAELILENRRQ